MYLFLCIAINPIKIVKYYFKLVNNITKYQYLQMLQLILMEFLCPKSNVKVERLRINFDYDVNKKTKKRFNFTF